MIFQQNRLLPQKQNKEILAGECKIKCNYFVSYLESSGNFGFEQLFWFVHLYLYDVFDLKQLSLELSRGYFAER